MAVLDDTRPIRAIDQSATSEPSRWLVMVIGSIIIIVLVAQTIAYYQPRRVRASSDPYLVDSCIVKAKTETLRPAWVKTGRNKAGCRMVPIK